MNTPLAGIFDTPIHPLLVNFTAALIPASVFTDWLGKLLKRSALTASAFWMLLYAAVITPATAFAGWWWYHRMEDMDHAQMGTHKWLGFSIGIVVIGMAIRRTLYYRRGQQPPWTYLLVAVLLVAATVVQGHLGAIMSFGSD